MKANKTQPYNQPMQVKGINNDSIFGIACIAGLKDGRHDDVLQMCCQQMNDNFCMVLSEIGHENMSIIAPEVMKGVNEYVTRHLVV